MSEAQYNNKGYGVHAFFVAGLAGAGVALLMALRTGKENRQKIKQVAEECKEKTNECTEEVRAQMLYDLYCKGQRSWLVAGAARRSLKKLKYD